MRCVSGYRWEKLPPGSCLKMGWNAGERQHSKIALLKRPQCDKNRCRSADVQKLQENTLFCKNRIDLISIGETIRVWSFEIPRREKKMKRTQTKIATAICLIAMSMCMADCAKKKDDSSNNLLLLALLSATAKNPNAGRSCNITSSGACIDYNNSALTTSQINTDCTGAGTSVDLTLNCAARNPTLTRVGTCNCNSGWAGSFTGASNITSVRYYSTNFTTSTAQTNCNTLSSPSFVAN